MEKKTNRTSKTIIISVIVGVIVLAGAVGLGLAIFKLGLFAKPFVEENDMTISNPNQTFSAPIEWFGIDSNLSIVNIPGMTSETATSTNKLYDYKIVEQNNDSVTISYKDAVEVTCKGSAPTNNIPKNLYNLNLLYSYFAPFDYYTGDCLYINISTITGAPVDDYQYTDVKWRGKTYRIGTKVERDQVQSKPSLEKNGDGTSTFNLHISVVYTVYVNMPKDYDGLMLAEFKQKYTQSDYNKLYEMAKTYLELSQQKELYGNESQELVELEERPNKTYKINQSMYDPEMTYNLNDFYVVRASELSK